MAKKTSNDNKDGIRINWGKDFSLLPKLDLLAVQKESYKWFLEKGIKQVLDEISPIDDFTEKNWTLELKDYRLGKPELRNIRLYDLRHYYVTKQMRRIQNAEIVRQIVGHKRLNTTQKYIHLLVGTSGEWIVEGTTDKERAKQLLATDFTYQLTTPDGTMLFRKQK